MQLFILLNVGLQKVLFSAQNGIGYPRYVFDAFVIAARLANFQLQIKLPLEK